MNLTVEEAISLLCLAREWDQAYSKCKECLLYNNPQGICNKTTESAALKLEEFIKQSNESTIKNQ